MEIPDIVKSERHREFDLYDEKIISTIVYEYLFNGLSHRELDDKVLQIHNSYSHGYQSMGILHCLGLRNEFKGIFDGINVEQAVEELERHNNSTYEELIDMLYPLQYVGSTVYSWNINNPITAIKTTDKSAFDYNGTGIPFAITPFFQVDNLELGNRRDIILRYKEKEYKAHIIKENQRGGRARLFWQSDLTNVLINKRQTLNEPFPLMVFQYVQKDIYEISFEVSKKPQEPKVYKPLKVMPILHKTSKNHGSIDTKKKKTSAKIDYAAKAKKDKDLGLIGEKYVLNFEMDKLHNCGLKDLSGSIKHISEELGDGEGYDILSYDDNQRPIYIEVKTTNSKNQDQFFISANELGFAENHQNDYYLYRVYDIKRKPKVAIYNYHDLIELQLIPTQYFAKFIDDTEC